MRSLVRENEPLSPRDRQALCEFLLQNSIPEEVSEPLWIETKNEAWNRLRNEPESRETFQTIVRSVLEDHSQPEVFRNYAVQHLGAWVAERNGGAEDIERLWDLAAEVGTSVGGTALIALCHAALETGGLPLSKVGSAAAATVSNGAACEASLIAALQLTGELGGALVREPALRIVQDTSRAVPVRIAALAALHEERGSRAVEKRVSEWEAGADPRLQKAARLWRARVGGGS
jgi:hypothetical protein